MHSYISGAVIRDLRESRGMTQAELADQIGVSGKAVSKWETGKGLPDISLLQPLASALHVSLIELMSGEQVKNRNVSGNLLRTRFYVCPVCGNVLHTVGEAMISCCGIVLPPCEAETADPEHEAVLTAVEDETYVQFAHPMSKAHYLSFLAYITSDRVQLVKRYPEGEAAARLQLRGRGYLYWYCNRHGLMKQKI